MSHLLPLTTLSTPRRVIACGAVCRPGHSPTHRDRPAPAGLTSQLQQGALLYPLYLLQHTAGWLLLLAAAPHLGDLRSLAMLLNLLQLAKCTAFRADDQWLLKLAFPPKSVEIALVFDDEHQLQVADAVARQAADWLGLCTAYLVLCVRRTGGLVALADVAGGVAGAAGGPDVAQSAGTAAGHADQVALPCSGV
jgi:hypothetical protein